jgi:hypothetical protein
VHAVELSSLARQPDFENRDIAELNLLCAQGMPDTRELNVPYLLRKLDHWAKLIDHGTYASRRRFKDNPQHYSNSYDVFRLVMLGTYLQKNLGVRYNRALAGAPTDDPLTWKPFNDSRHLFIHGPLQGFSAAHA